MTTYLLLACIIKRSGAGYPDVIVVVVVFNFSLCMTAIILLFPRLIIPEPTAGVSRQQ